MVRRASRFRPDTLQLKVTLRGSKPPIWRRLLVPGNFNLAQLHQALQIGMGWQESHLHQFVAGEDYYGPDDPADFTCPKDETAMMLQKVLRAEGDTLVYEYDFGDGWEHTVLLEKFFPYVEGEPLPRCIDGKRACPPEDCGGVGGYAYLLEVLADPAHPEHRDLREWLGIDAFDPAALDLSVINFELGEFFGGGPERRPPPDAEPDVEPA